MHTLDNLDLIWPSVIIIVCMIPPVLYVQVFRWRTAASIFWLLLVTIPVLLVFRVVSSCSLLHPFTWITGTHVHTHSLTLI